MAMSRGVEGGTLNSSRRIRGLDKLQSVMTSAAWTDLSQIRRIDFDTVASELLIVSVFVQGPRAIDGAAWRVVMKFHGVRQLTLRDAGPFLQITGFSIRDAAHGNPWLEVDDYEEGRMSFLAESCDVLDVEPCTSPWPGENA